MLYRQANVESYKNHVNELIEKVLPTRYELGRNYMLGMEAIYFDTTVTGEIGFRLSDEMSSLDSLLSNQVGIDTLGKRMSEMLVHWQFHQETVSVTDNDIATRFSRLRARWADFRSEGESNHLWRIKVETGLPVCNGTLEVHDVILHNLHDEFTERLSQYVNSDATNEETFRVEFCVLRGSRWDGPSIGPMMAVRRGKNITASARDVA